MFYFYLPRDANSYPEEWDFQVTQNNRYELFFLYIAFNLLSALFYECYAKISKFAVKKCSVRLLPTTLTWKPRMQKY